MHQKLKLYLNRHSLKRVKKVLVYVYIRSAALFRKIRHNIKIAQYFLYYFKRQKFLPKEHIVVVARHNEDLKWLKSLDLNFAVYNKGRGDTLIKYPSLPNIGKEAHTYLHFIISNYDNLPDRVTFLQGNPFDHCKDIILFLNKINDFQEIQPLSYCLLPAYHPKLKNENEFEFGIPKEKIVNDHKISVNNISYFVERLDNRLRTTWPYTFISSWSESTKHVKQHNDKSLFALLNKVGLSQKTSVLFSHGAQFSVSKEKILNHPRSFYISLLKYSYKEEENPGWLERLWLTIFEYDLPVDLHKNV
jgi:hypothetical protein